MSAENHLNNNNLNVEEFETIQTLKNQISMFQQQSAALKKEEQEIDAIKQNLFRGNDIKEETEPSKFSPLTYSSHLKTSIEEYEELIDEIDDPIISDENDLDDDDDEDADEYKDVLLEIAQTKIRKLENEIFHLKASARDDDKYIAELEGDIRNLESSLKKLQSPKREIEFLQNQVENARHQYFNLSSEYRRREEANKERSEAYESMKTKFLGHLVKITKEKKELSEKLEEKDKENQQLREIIANFQGSKTSESATSMLDTVKTTSTTIDDESMDLSNPSTSSAAAAAANVVNVPSKSFSVKRKFARFMLLMPFSSSN